MVLCAFSRIEHVWQLRKCKEKYADSSVLFPFLCLKSNATVSYMLMTQLINLKDLLENKFSHTQNIFYKFMHWLFDFWIRLLICDQFLKLTGWHFMCCTQNSKCFNFDAFIPYLAMNYFDLFISRNQLPVLQISKPEIFWNIHVVFPQICAYIYFPTSLIRMCLAVWEMILFLLPFVVLHLLGRSETKLSDSSILR